MIILTPIEVSAFGSFPFVGGIFDHSIEPVPTHLYGLLTCKEDFDQEHKLRQVDI